MKSQTKLLLKKALMHWYLDACKFDEAESHRYTKEIIEEIERWNRWVNNNENRTIRTNSG